MLELTNEVVIIIMDECDWALAKIPNAIFRSIIFFLSVEDVVSLAKTCRRAYFLITFDNYLWTLLIKRDFDISCTNCEGSTKRLYELLNDTYCVSCKEFDLEKKYCHGHQEKS